MGKPVALEGGLEPVHAALGRSDPDRDQSVILVPFAPDRNRYGLRGPPSRLEMNSLRSALTAAPASQIIPTIRGIRVTSKNELAPSTEATTRGTAFTQNRGHSLRSQ